VTQKLSLTTYSDNAATISKTLRLFLTDKMLDIICERTNDEGSRIFAETNEEWKDVMKEEFFAFVGILILCGVLKKCKEPVYELWAVKSLYYRPVFPATMSRDRFFQILRCLRFNDE
jgi:hypothetical protein